MSQRDLLPPAAAGHSLECWGGGQTRGPAEPRGRCIVEYEGGR